MKARGGDAGFALLDAMVALAILGVILGMFMQVVQSTAMARTHADQARRAMLVAQSRLAQAMETDEPDPAGRDGPFRWRAVVAPYQGVDNSHGLEQVSVTVADVASGQVVASLQSLRLARAGAP